MSDARPYELNCSKVEVINLKLAPTVMGVLFILYAYPTEKTDSLPEKLEV